MLHQFSLEPQVQSTNISFKEFVILSGGLGSSAYVRQSIQQQLVSFPHPNATTAVVVPCQDPQLVVVRGLLLDHQQRMETGNMSVLASRVARASYGVIVKEVYSPAKHFDEEVISDQFGSGKRWAVNQVQWMIRKVRQLERRFCAASKPSSLTCRVG